MNDPCRLSASEAVERMARGALTSEALVAACLERIEEREPEVGAWVHLDPDYSLAQARERDRASGRGPLHGVPFAVKDIMDTADMPTGYGSPIYDGYRPRADAACVSLALAAGGVLLGKTVTTEFASRHPGKTGNPHDPRRTPGGSSSGSAAAVADCMAFMAFGTQTLGSVIRPASYCGCVGYKPSYGEVSTSGAKENTASFDTVGLFGRSVEDLPRFRAAVTGAPLQPLAPVSAGDLRIGLCRTPLWDRAQDYTKALVEGAAARLAEAGAKVSDLDLGGPFADFETMGRRVSDYEIARALSWERTRRFDRLSGFQQGKLADWPGVSYEEYREGERVIAACRAYLEEAAKDFDALLTPAATGEAPEGLGDTGDTSFNILATWTHAPCVTLPVFEGPTGLPVGLQVVGRRCRDHRLFEVSRAVLRALSEQGPRPERAGFA